MDIQTVKIQKPEAINFILGQSHFIKTVEDIHEALVGTVPGIKFGLAFCEASGSCLIRWTGTDEAMIALAKSDERGSKTPPRCDHAALEESFERGLCQVRREATVRYIRRLISGR